MKKALIFSLLTSLLFLGACTNQTQNNTSISNKQNSQTNTQSQANAFRGIDKSDFVNAAALISSLPKEELSDQEKESLIQMREEEKLAHDVYLTLYQKWNLPIFSNIARSEQTHTDAIKVLLERYNIEDPVKSEEIGVFTSPKLQKLYNDLVLQGEKSLLDGLKIGATVEDLDIKDLEDFMKTVNNQDIILVYQNLIKGSRNHLRSFVRLIKANGGSYAPQYIDAEYYQKVISSEMERNVIGGFNTGYNQNSKTETPQGTGQGRRQGQMNR